MSRTGYAAATTVPVSRSFDEIERMLSRFGCSSFGYDRLDSGKSVEIRFQIRNTFVRMTMAMPDKEQFKFTKARPWTERAESAIERDWEQACRSKWRVLTLAIKAKLSLIDEGISTVEREFLADVVTGSGETVGDKLIPMIMAIEPGKILEIPDATESDVDDSIDAEWGEVE